MPEDSRARPGQGVWREDETDARLREITAQILALETERCQLLARIARSRYYRLLGCASLVEYGRQLCLRPSSTWDRAKTGFLMGMRPDLGGAIRKGEIAAQAGASLHDVLLLPDEDPETWIERAKTLSTPEFCARVDEHLVSRKLGGPPIRMSLLISPRGKRLFDKAREIAERKAGRALSEGETVEELAEEYVSHDDATRHRHHRRNAPAPRKPKGRHIPAAVRRIVWERDGGCCAVPGCRRKGKLHFSHIVPFRRGGPATVENILLLCAVHNHMMESGLLRIRGTANDPRFLDASGKPYRLKGSAGRGDRERDPP